MPDLLIPAIVILVLLAVGAVVIVLVWEKPPAETDDPDESPEYLLDRFDRWDER